MNPEAIGKFISEERKAKGLTQKELGEALGLSDKAVSKWENGRSMPDLAVMDDLCKLLDISINDLLSGEKLSEDSYTRKAEENMKDLMNETTHANRASRIGSVLFRLCLPDRGDSLDHALFRRNNDLRNAPGYSVTYLHAILYCSLPCLLGQPWEFRQRGMPDILS